MTYLRTDFETDFIMIEFIIDTFINQFYYRQIQDFIIDKFSD